MRKKSKNIHLSPINLAHLKGIKDRSKRKTLAVALSPFFESIAECALDINDSAFLCEDFHPGPEPYLSFIIPPKNRFRIYWNADVRPEVMSFLDGYRRPSSSKTHAWIDKVDGWGGVYRKDLMTSPLMKTSSGLELSVDSLSLRLPIQNIDILYRPQDWVYDFISDAKNYLRKHGRKNQTLEKKDLRKIETASSYFAERTSKIERVINETARRIGSLTRNFNDDILDNLDHRKWQFFWNWNRERPKNDNDFSLFVKRSNGRILLAANLDGGQPYELDVEDDKYLLRDAVYIENGWVDELITFLKSKKKRQ